MVHNALVSMPDGMSPALIVERFDIRRGDNDARMLALEDFTSVLGVPTEAKYDGTVERVARALRPLSTAPDKDLLLVLGITARSASRIPGHSLYRKNVF